MSPAKILVILILYTKLLSADTAWDSFRSFPPLNVIYHPVSTSSPEAQHAFNQGLTAIYAFNYDAAVRNFDRASQLDPNLAMAYWGMALALDQNLESRSTLMHAKLTDFLCQKALDLSSHATEKEQAYIHALSQRFKENSNVDKNQLRKAYSESMHELTVRFPDDLDAATLYAESLMDLLFWDLWKDGAKPFKETREILQTLESNLVRNPFHLGANHYYIHAMENSPFPERALMSAYRLSQMDLADWGHLIHTTTHIFLRVGSYEDSVTANEKAVEADKRYISLYGLEGQYPLKYFAHNLSFLTVSYLWQDRYEEALHASQELANTVRPYVPHLSFFEFDVLMPLEVYLYFHKWEEILQIPEPKQNEQALRTFWLYARGMALASKGDIEQATKTQRSFMQEKKKYLQLHRTNFAETFFYYAETTLQAALAKAKGNESEAIRFLKAAVTKQKQFFDFTWFYPIGQTLGAALIENGQPQEAEHLFRTLLRQMPRNGRSLFGLFKALEIQKKAGYSSDRECRAALNHSQKELKLSDL